MTVPGLPSNPLFITAQTGPVGVRLLAVLIGNATLSRTGGTSASASSGGGGWQVVDRSRRMASTEWLDFYPFVMTMDLLLDGGTGMEPQSVEPGCSFLESLEEPVVGSVPPLPPIVTVAGPVPHTDLFWVVSRLSFNGGDGGAIRNAAGIRTQQSVTLELTQYSPSLAISSGVSPAQAAALAAGTTAGQAVVIPTGSTYTVKSGDTLQSIAATVLLNTSLWISLAILNGLSFSAILDSGQLLQLPAAS